MTTRRDAFLQRVREAVAAGNRPGEATAPPERGRVGYQGAGPDPVGRFRDELTAAGGQLHLVPDSESAVRAVQTIARDRVARRVLLGRGAFLDTLGLAGRLRAVGLEVACANGLSPETSREPFFAADLGVSGVTYLIAETGSIVLLARPDEPRSLSLLPPVHVAVAERSQLLPDLFDLFEGRTEMPSCLTLITGPSKTGDIELRLVTGVHGPGEVHVVLVGA
jgi:L-lactate utilization protein LutC